MKKLFAILLTFCLVMSLPLMAMAEETAPETEAATEEVTAAPETVEETAAPAETVEETESAETETEYKMNVGFYPETLMTTLPIMGMGMLGIFLVTCVIVLAVVILSKVGKEKDEE